ATAIFAAFLLIVLGGLQPKDVFAQYFDPVIVLLLGGFVIAVAIAKTGLDEYIAYRILSKVGTKPKMVILGLMLTTAFISMWISNSAAAAIIMPIALVILVKNRAKPGKSNFGKASVLAVAYGATIGGIGTIIGSTPNVMAAKFIHSAGLSFNFYDWFYRGFPFMLVFMLLGWAVLVNLYKPEKTRIETVKKISKMTKEQKIVVAVFALTILLWATESLHGIESSVVSLVPIILYYFLGILSTNDFVKVDWPTLMLLGGGLALGFGIHSAGLDLYFASLISHAVIGSNIFMLFLVLGVFGALLTLFISNTTSAAIYLPIVVALASAFGANFTNTVVVAAVAVSLDFTFPFGTPPTAIAYATKYVNTKDIAKAGFIITVIGILLLAVMGTLW
ncbi:MAG: DASS family sodium-coupled anion symporter, partial [Candidatus Aenigmarchaeota archaeon]|nr:DASS family sodium-coupled anion symporter [Candidatus Aenigmarchaeota archaeon]